MRFIAVFLVFLTMCFLPAQESLAKDGSEFLKLQKGKAVQIDASNEVYIFGLVNGFTAKCAWPYKEHFQTVMSYLGSEGARSRYPESPEAQEDLQQYFSKNTCGPTKFTEALRDTIPSPTGSVFVKSCMTVWNNENVCVCMANIGHEIDPGFYDLDYHSDKIEAMGVWRASEVCYREGKF